MSFPKAVMFDMDGLIFDTETVYKVAWQSSAEKLGFLIDEDFWFSLIGVKNEECENRLMHKFGSKFSINIFQKMWRQVFNEIVDNFGMEYKRGFVDLFNYLVLNDFYVGLTTSSSREDIRRNFKGKMELDQFSLILSGDEIKESKPSPETYLMASKISCISPNEIIVFEDSINGMYSAINAGCLAVMIPDILKPDEYIKEKSFMILKSLDDAIERIFKNQKIWIK